jgi:hypothetical protein
VLRAVTVKGSGQHWITTVLVPQVFLQYRLVDRERVSSRGLIVNSEFSKTSMQQRLIYTISPPHFSIVNVSHVHFWKRRVCWDAANPVSAESVRHALAD